MKVHNAIVVLGALALLVVGTAAQDEPIKIGVVDSEQLFMSTDIGRTAKAEMDRKRSEASAKLAPLAEQLQAMDAEREAKQFVLSQEAMQKKQNEMDGVLNQLQNREKEAKGQLMIDLRQIQGELEKTFQEVITETGREQGFTLILQRNTPGLIYSREALDITDLIIAQTNKK
jgi:outer membrane protein